MYLKAVDGSKFHNLTFKIVNKFVYTIIYWFYWSIYALYFNTYQCRRWWHAFI